MDKNLTNLYAEHVATRMLELERALEAESFESLLIHSGSPKRAFLDDFEYSFKANPHFLAWLPLDLHPECILQLSPGDKPILHYYQPDDYWNKPPADPQSWWAQWFDVQMLTTPIRTDQLSTSGRTAVIDELAGTDKEGRRWFNPQGLINRLHLDRTRKTAYEQECILAANRKAAAGHRAAQAAFKQGMSEFDIHLAYCAAAGQGEAELPYGNIVALNENGATLHYQSKALSPPATINSFLIDAGATYHAYAADITRTYSFGDPLFAEMIEAMDAMQLDIVSRCIAGCDYRELHLSTHLAIADLLHRFGVLKISPEAALESGVSNVFFPHGLGHFLGIQVHDVAGLIADAAGTPIDRPEGHPFLRLTRTLEAGNVVTIEPGFYFVEPLLAALKSGPQHSVVNWDLVEQLMPFGGIRIEDDVLVLAAGNRNLSREAFAET